MRKERACDSSGQSYQSSADTRSKPGVYGTDSKEVGGIRLAGETELLCKTETQAEGIADFLEDLGFKNIRTGYYDPKEDEQNGETDEYTGLYYVCWD